MTAPPRPKRRPRASRALLGPLIGALLAGGCGHNLLDWAPLAAARPPEAVAVTVDAAWVKRSDVPHVSAFYDALAAYGVWNQDEALGWIWAPSDPDYAPYARGRWVETEAGPTFLSEDPHGWATAHYGRWLHRDRWYWVPGTRWGPAWVSWRVGQAGGQTLVGWAPRGPDQVSWVLPEGAWRFVAMDELSHPQVTSRAYPPSDELWLLTHTRPAERTAQAELGGFVVGPEVRFAGWRAHKVPLDRLPQARLRWLPRSERPETPRVGPQGVRAAPAAGQRFGRTPIEATPPKTRAPRKDPKRDERDRQRAPRVPRTF